MSTELSSESVGSFGMDIIPSSVGPGDGDVSCNLDVDELNPSWIEHDGKRLSISQKLDDKRFTKLFEATSDFLERIQALVILLRRETNRVLERSWGKTRGIEKMAPVLKVLDDIDCGFRGMMQYLHEDLLYGNSKSTDWKCDRPLFPVRKLQGVDGALVDRQEFSSKEFCRHDPAVEDDDYIVNENQTTNDDDYRPADDATRQLRRRRGRPAFRYLVLNRGIWDETDERLATEVALISQAVGDDRNLARWREEKQTAESIHCRLCNKTLKADFYTFAFHVLSVHGDKKHVCRICGKKFSRAAYLRVHVTTAHRGGAVKCPDCAKGFSTRWVMEDHRTRVHSGVKHECQLCPKQFCNMFLLRDHVKIVHDKKFDFVCTQCDQTFAKANALRRHVRVKHDGLCDKVPCPDCGQNFSENYLKLHRRSVHGGRNFACTAPRCDKKFPLKAQLTSHFNIVHEKRKVKCDNCEAEFTEVRKLKNHVEVTHKGVRFPCQQCGKLFKSKRNLTVHSKLHTSVRLQCRDCPQSFSQLHSLINHAKKKHCAVAGAPSLPKKVVKLPSGDLKNVAVSSDNPASSILDSMVESLTSQTIFSLTDGSTSFPSSTASRVAPEVSVPAAAPRLALDDVSSETALNSPATSSPAPRIGKWRAKARSSAAMPMGSLVPTVESRFQHDLPDIFPGNFTNSGSSITLAPISESHDFSQSDVSFVNVAPQLIAPTEEDIEISSLTQAPITLSSNALLPIDTIQDGTTYILLPAGFQLDRI